jgi:UDP-N-acetylmuramate dehydrogenase
MVSEALIEELQTMVEVRREEPLARHTTFGIGGPADIYVAASTSDELRQLAALCHRHETPFFVLGAGSNILIGDKGIRVIVIENRARRVEAPQERQNGSALFRVESGANLASLARDLTRKGFAGLEWAGGIPGTIGGAVVYNAGAYDGCLANVLIGVGMADKEGQEYALDINELGLGYRESGFTRRLFTGQVILWAELRLVPGSIEELQKKTAEFDHLRQESQPRGRSAGSIFKNTREYPSWWLIDQVGLRGHRIGDAEFSVKHPNFILNVGQARAADVKALMELAQEKVKAEFSIKLSPEVAFVGEGFGNDSE